VVRLRQGQADAETVYDDDPAAVAQRWAAQGAEWLHVVNLDGALEEASANLEVLQRIIAAVEVPVQFGGGLRDFEAIEDAFDLGVARVVIGTAAVLHPTLLDLALDKYGPESVAVGIDAREGRVAIRGWQQLTDVSAIAFALEVKDRGVERVIYTDIVRDGMLSGVNVEAAVELARATGLRVIASGGVASLDDVRRLRDHEADGIEGVIIGQALYTGAVQLSEAIQVASSIL
jgi:phosphoribosylformimino-5-aminoimidazole carboxamide ribotide isomerase